MEKVTLDDLREKMADFARERDWDQFHSPRNLLLALVGEVGELSEIFQWRGEVPRGLPGWDEADKVHLGEELSDVVLYLVRLADICDIDLGGAALRKLQLNATKYPVSRCRGSSKKHTQYANNSDSVGGSNHLEGDILAAEDDAAVTSVDAAVASNGGEQGGFPPTVDPAIGLPR